MVDQQQLEQERAGEAGTTLVELLVVVMLLSIVGLITTTGIVRGFNAQQDATNVAETLDGMRIATQRVRDFARGADEVCASSTEQTMVLWTDDNNDGLVQNVEKDIFELDTSGDTPVFQRRVGTTEVQIIRDDILDDAIFAYDFDQATGSGRPATEQPSELECTDGATLTGGVSLIRSVQVTFVVDHPDPDQPDLTTSTSVRIRNADLIEEPNNAPIAKFEFECEPDSTTCSFDASDSTDPDGTVESWTWDFGDGSTGSGETISNDYDLGGTEYDVTLLVVDDDGAVDTIQKTVKTGVLDGNAQPVAEFTYVCGSDTVAGGSGRYCEFDGSNSSDDGSITKYEWDFDGDGTIDDTGQTTSHTYDLNGTYSVSLVVTDDHLTPATSDPEIKSVVASDFAMRVEALKADVTEKNNTFSVDFTVELSLTGTGTPGDGILVSVQLDGDKTRTDSCSTGTAGTCTVSVSGVDNQTFESLLVTNLSDDSGTYTYDPNQDHFDEIVVDKNNNATCRLDGEVVDSSTTKGCTP